MTDRPYVDFHQPQPEPEAAERRPARVQGGWPGRDLPPGTVIFNATQVLEAVGAAFKFTAAKLLSRDRTRHVSEARDAVQWLLRRHSRAGLKELSIAVGRHDHTSAMHAIRRAEERRAIDPWFRETTDRLERELEEKAAA